jgi:hypothetical protein
VCCATPAGTTETASGGCAAFWRSSSAPRRGRRDPVRLAVGDTLDFWRVEAFEKDRLLRLSSEMKTPGASGYSSSQRRPSRNDPAPDSNLRSHGLAGRTYWYARTRFITSFSRGSCEGSNGLRSRAGEAHSTVRRRRRHRSPGPRTIFRTAESPSVAKTMKLVMSKIGPAQLAVEDVAVSRVRLL